HRLVQAAARVQLGRRDAALLLHDLPVVHGLPAAVGPARAVGGHRGLRDRERHTGGGLGSRLPAVRWISARSERLTSVLCLTRRRVASRDRLPHRHPLLEDPEGWRYLGAALGDR